ncbi:MAG: FHA domain-containing protein, partial [Acidobacteriota bacterium]
GEPVTLLLSSRVAALPGLAERLAETGPAEIITLPAEAAARGARRHHDAVRSPGEALRFVMRLPSAAPSSTAPRGTDSETLESSPPARTASPAPTHLVHAGLAYPLGGEPLLLGSAPPEGSYRIELGNSAGGVAALHCSLYRRDGRTFVESRPSHGLFLNGRRIEGRVELAVGDRLRLGSPAVELQIITLRNEHGAASD